MRMRIGSKLPFIAEGMVTNVIMRIRTMTVKNCVEHKFGKIRPRVEVHGIVSVTDHFSNSLRWFIVDIPHCKNLFSLKQIT